MYFVLTIIIVRGFSNLPADRPARKIVGCYTFGMFFLTMVWYASSVVADDNLSSGFTAASHTGLGSLGTSSSGVVVALYVREICQVLEICCAEGLLVSRREVC
jgi:hypothetical protein